MGNYQYTVCFLDFFSYKVLQVGISVAVNGRCSDIAVELYLTGTGRAVYWLLQLGNVSGVPNFFSRVL
jgi:hypothetical protein